MYSGQGSQNFFPPHHGGGPGGPGFAPPFPSTPNKPVGVYWDIENCPIPKDVQASSVVHFIRQSFILNRLNHREFEFLVAADIMRLRSDIPKDLDKTGGVVLAHVSGDSKNAADEKIRESMRRFVDTHASYNPMLILISGDIDFVNDLRGYQTRLGCIVVVLHGATASSHFKAGWNEMYAFKEFLLRMPSPPTTKAVTNGKGNQNQAPNNSANPGAGYNNANPGGGYNPRGHEPRGQNTNPGTAGPRPQGQMNPRFRNPNPGPASQPHNQTQSPQHSGFNPRNAARFPVPVDGFNANKGAQVHAQHQQQNMDSSNAGGEAKVSNRAKKRAQKHGSNSNLATAGLNFHNGSNSALNQPQSEGQNNQSRKNKNKGQGQSQMSSGGQSQMGHGGQPLMSIETHHHPSGQDGNHALPQQQSSGASDLEKRQPKQKKERNRSGMNPGNLQNADYKGNANATVPKPIDSQGPKPNIILMVSGLPGKMDFRILKDHLQQYASSVAGKVMYVHNGQAFITFRRQADADRAIELFQGKEVYGKKLDIRLSKTIPFQNPRPGTGGSGPAQGSAAADQPTKDTNADEFVMVDPRPPRPPPPVNAGFVGNAGNTSPGVVASSSSNSNLLAHAFVDFATAAMNELTLQQGENSGQQQPPGQKQKKQKVKADPNCVIQ